jgi:tRNA(fMet)-specific endonuclease VapC
MNYLLDSTVMIDGLRGRGPGFEFLVSTSARDNLYVSAITVAEVHAGERPNERAQTAEFLAGFSILPVDERIARAAGYLKNHWARRGKTLWLTDALIAATAMEHDMTMVTSNSRDFPMREIKLLAL